MNLAVTHIKAATLARDLRAEVSGMRIFNATDWQANQAFIANRLDKILAQLDAPREERRIDPLGVTVLSRNNDEKVIDFIEAIAASRHPGLDGDDQAPFNHDV
jgi:hypothetical protein